MEKNSKIYVAGSTGLVGGAIVKYLQNEGYTNVITRTRHELDLFDKQAVHRFYQEVQPEYVIVSAARVGGIKANMTYPADFLYENLEIQNNLIWGAHLFGVRRLLFLGSSCIYPRECPQPMKEEYLMAGKLEPTNEGYAIAKIAGMRLCEYVSKQFGKDFISCMPTNIYGPGDHFDASTSHVVPGIMSRMYEAKLHGDKELVIWGTGETRREFLFVTDLASAIVWLLEHYEDKQFLNVGTGVDISINELAQLLKDIIGYEGEFVHDLSKPDGFPRKLLDVSRINSLGWRSNISIEKGLTETYEWFLEQKNLNLL